MIHQMLRPIFVAGLHRAKTCTSPSHFRLGIVFATSLVALAGCSLPPHSKTRQSANQATKAAGNVYMLEVRAVISEFQLVKTAS